MRFLDVILWFFPAKWIFFPPYTPVYKEGREDILIYQDHVISEELAWSDSLYKEESV